MAKRFGHLMVQITAFDNLWAAFRKAAKGKRSQPEVAAFENDLMPNLVALQEALQSGEWRPGVYRSFHIHEPKHRLISAAPFADRVVHHALVRVIEPLFERTFIGDSYANRVGKGSHAALDRAQGWMRHYPFVLQCDIRQFFPQVDHQVLMGVLARKLACPATLALCGHILAGGEDGRSEPLFFPGDDLLAATRSRGLPIGNLTSQFWANVLLNELDQFVKRELHWGPYLRYVDDFLLLGHDKAALWQAREAIVQKLAALRLALHTRSSTVAAAATGVPFLGFRLFAHYRRLKARNVKAFVRRQAVWRRAVARGDMGLANVSVATAGWVAHARHAHSLRLRSALLARPFRVGRACA
ncbi:MAG: RNA-dependent DNA polymerase [Ideonella sp. MAG2]|nr:MAG: RNA-dependent DNA polymerase [Ideonella sp. MAG2]